MTAAFSSDDMFPRVLHFHANLARCISNRAIVYNKNGNPSEVLKSLTFTPLPPPGPESLNIRFLLSPINPADVNVVEGVYPSKPTLCDSLNETGLGSGQEPVFIGGNEGLAEVVQVGQGVSHLKEKDWVVMAKPQVGTWTTCRNVHFDDVVRVPQASLTEVQAATMTVNPPTAYSMLHDFTALHKGDWIVQNGANSAVGQAVIQIAAAVGLRSINFVRNRENLSELKQQLESLGANFVFTYDDLGDKAFRKQVKDITSGAEISLGLNCVGGRETSLMAGLLGNDAHLVSYGAMSKQPLSLPTSLFIFKNLTSHGFWQTRWVANKLRPEREHLMQVLADMMEQGKLKEPEHEIVTVKANESDEEASRRISEIFTKMASGRFGKKVLLRMESIQ
ncbi:hypothetical protein C8J56DRAFT_953880 [Mycena floridula]|nr:hypothetical protein C8J56DRAFT_953880 [Mycena floridula]